MLSRWPVSTQIERMLRDTLVHRIVIVPIVGRDQFGQPLFGSPRPAVPCFITGTTRRILSPTGTEQQMNWQILFGPRSPIAIGDRVQNGHDPDGRVILSSAVIMHIEDDHSSRYGHILRTAWCMVQ